MNTKLTVLALKVFSSSKNELPPALLDLVHTVSRI